MANGKSGRPKAKDPKTHRYNFKLNDEQELHFRKMLEEAGYRENISKFILARLFGGEFRVYKSDPTGAKYVARLNDFYWQFSRIGNNYNQIVKQVNTHFSEQAIPVQLDMLIGYTRQLKALSEKIASLTEELRKQWLPE